MENINKSHQKNSLIELYRFVFAIWVMYYHGYFLKPSNQWFDKGYISVEFFFILTGFFLIQLFKKQEDKNLFKGCIQIGYKKLKPCDFTVITTLLLAFIHYGVFYHEFSFGYMWYIKVFVIVSILYFVLYRISKNNLKLFLLLIFIIITICNIFNYCYTDLSSVGIYRGIVAIGLGMLISQIPQNHLKIKKFNVNIIFTIITITITTILALYNYLYNINFIFIYILFPSLLYFTSCIKFNFKLFNYLGGISFGLYGYQTVCRIFEEIGTLHKSNQTWIMTLVIFSCAIIDDLIKRLIKYIKTKTITQQNTIKEKL